MLRVKALCSEKEGEGAVIERLPGETWGVEDMERGGSSSVAVGVQPAHGNPQLGAWGWAGVGRCNCYESEPEHAQTTTLTTHVNVSVHPGELVHTLQQLG